MPTKTAIFITSSLTFFAFSLFSLDYQWPIHPKKKSKINITSTFGESRGDHFHNGVDIPGKNRKVFPVKEGKLLYFNTGKHFLGEIPFGGGQTIVLQHKSTQTGYMHLSEVNPQFEKNRFVANDTLLGKSGNSGHSGGYHLHFYVYGSRTKTFYNPLLLLNHNFYYDTKAPKVKGYAVKIHNKAIRIKINKPIKLSNNFPFYASIVDQGIKKERWGIYGLSVFNANHKILVQYKFDKIVYKKNKWRTTSGLSFNQVYFENMYYIGNHYKEQPILNLSIYALKGPKTLVRQQLKIVSSSIK